MDGAAGACTTVSCAAALGTLPLALTATARNHAPLSFIDVGAVTRLACVSAGRSVQATALALRCHTKVGAGVPVTATRKAAGCPATALTACGCSVNSGAAGASTTEI